MGPAAAEGLGLPSRGAAHLDCDSVPIRPSRMWACEGGPGGWGGEIHTRAATHLYFPSSEVAPDVPRSWLDGLDKCFLPGMVPAVHWRLIHPTRSKQKGVTTHISPLWERILVGAYRRHEWPRDADPGVDGEFAAAASLMFIVGDAFRETGQRGTP